MVRIHLHKSVCLSHNSYIFSPCFFLSRVFYTRLSLYAEFVRADAQSGRVPPVGAAVTAAAPVPVSPRAEAHFRAIDQASTYLDDIIALNLIDAAAVHAVAS